MNCYKIVKRYGSKTLTFSAERHGVNLLTMKKGTFYSYTCSRSEVAYAENKKTVPTIGKLMAYDSLESAVKFLKTYQCIHKIGKSSKAVLMINLAIFECEVEPSAKQDYVVGDSFALSGNESLRMFWNTQDDGSIKIEQTEEPMKAFHCPSLNCRAFYPPEGTVFCDSITLRKELENPLESFDKKFLFDED